MTLEEYRVSAENVIYLAACMVNGVKPNAKRVAGMNLEQLYTAADRHLLTGITAYALENAGIHDPAFIQAQNKAIRKVALFDSERKDVLDELEKAGIWYMPLKGCVLKEKYPQIGMRQMADNDILYDVLRSEDVRKIMESLGFTTVLYVRDNGYSHDVHKKEPVCNFEMHRALFPPGVDDAIFAYYRNIRQKMVKDEGNDYGYHLSPEDFYLYMTAHEYKHYSNGGTGLRSLLDTYVYLHSTKLNMAYVAAEAEKIGIAAFEEANRTLAQHLFSGEELTAEDLEMLDYILSSGTYGSIVHRVKNTMKKKHWTKAQYALGRFFVPVSRKNPDYDAYANVYPFFYKHILLLPLLPFYRTFRAIKAGKFRAEAKAIWQAKDKAGI